MQQSKDSLDSLQQLSQNWMPVDKEYIKFLKNNYSNLYKRLIEIQNSTTINLYGLTIDGKAAFRYCYSDLRLCLSQAKEYYHCYDCSYADDAALCRKCFNLQFHKNHNWICQAMPDKPYCDCGLQHRINPKAMCKCHNSLNKITQPLTSQQRYIFKSFFSLFSKIILNILSHSKNTFGHFNKYVETLREYSKFSVEYCSQLYEIFDSKFQEKSELTILQKFVELNRYKNVLDDSFLFLMTHLCQYPPFQYILNQALYTQVPYTCNQKLLKFYYQISDNFEVLNKLADNKIIVYNKEKQNLNYTVIKFYCQILQKYKKSNRYGLLIPVWRYLQSQTQILKQFFATRALAIEQTFTSKLFTILYDSIADLEFFQEIVSLLLTQWKYREFQGYFSHSRFYSQIAKVVLKAVKGNIHQVWIVFQKCDKEFLSKFISFYFIQLFIDRKKCKFNSLTAVCFVQVIKKFNLQCINLVNLPSSIPILKMGRILSIVLRNLTSYNYVKNLEILKIAKSIGNEDLVKEMQQKIFEWFQQQFYRRTQMSQNIVIQFKRQGVLQIEKVKRFLVEQSTFSNGSKTFTYNGPDVDVNPDLLLYGLNKGQEAYGLRDDEDKSMFSSQERLEVVTILFEKAIEKIDYSKFSSHNKTDRYMICASAVILNKITKGQNPIFQKFAQKLKQLSIQIRKPNESVDRLLRINSYKPKPVQTTKIKEQNITKIQQSSTKQLKMEHQQTKSTQQEQKKQMVKVEEQIKTSENIFLESIQETQKEEKMPKVQKKYEEVKQKTRQQLLNEEKKKNKISRIAEKYNKKSKKFLQMHQSLIKQNQKQVCLVCRQTLSDYGLLSFYVNLEKKTKGVISKQYNINNRFHQFTMDSCFHAIHPKCSGNNNKKCILCTNTFDCFVPIVTEELDEESQSLISRMWWEEDFVQLIYKKFGKLSDFQIIMNMIQSFVMSISTMYLLPQKSSKIPVSKTQKWLSFLSHMIKIQPPQTKSQLQTEIQAYLGESQNTVHFLNTVRIIVSLSVISKVYNEIPVGYVAVIRETVFNLVKKIQNMFQFGYCRELIRHLGVILGENFEDGKKFIQMPDIQALWRELKFLTGLPETILQLRRKYEACPKCSSISSFFCLGCDKIICGTCTRISLHVRSGCVCIDIGTGTLSYPDIANNRQETVGLYFNCFKEQYKPRQSELDSYYIDMNVINKAIEKILS